MRDNWNKYREASITLLLFGVAFIVIVAVIAIFGGSLMKIFGFQYESVGSIILFFIIATIISFPFSLIAEALPKVLLSFGKLTKREAVLLYVVLDTLVTALGLYVVDYFMETISATILSIMVVSFVFSLMGIRDIGKKLGG